MKYNISKDDDLRHRLNHRLSNRLRYRLGILLWIRITIHIRMRLINPLLLRDRLERLRHRLDPRLVRYEV